MISKEEGRRESKFDENYEISGAVDNVLYSNMSHIKFMILFALVFCLIEDVTSVAQSQKCSEGTYLHQRDDTSSCVECPHGTFMPWKNHTADKCFDCTKVEDPTIEILITPCNRFHDADVQCNEGYYRRLARHPKDKPTCLTCRPACSDFNPYQVHPCQNFSDLGCCIGENYDYIIGEGGVRMCRERPWMCRTGEYLYRDYDCKPCPENTFMPEDYHSFPKCWDCLYLSEADLPLNTVIIQPCTSTQSPRYGCKEGFYVNHGQGFLGDDIGCSPCQTCDEGKYVGQQCGMYNDTVCCDKSNMTVVDGPNGTQCVEKIDCKDGSYNPPACDKTCSQHCRVSETSDVSPCDNINGTCHFGCLNGYTGDMCETVQEKSRNQEYINGGIGEHTHTIAPWIILVLVVLVLIGCVMNNKYCPGSGPKWWRILVSHIFRQPKIAVAVETKLGQPLRKVHFLSWPEIVSTEVTEQGQALIEAHQNTKIGNLHNSLIWCEKNPGHQNFISPKCSTI